jgi:hypothetical protein
MFIINCISKGRDTVTSFVYGIMTNHGLITKLEKKFDYAIARDKNVLKFGRESDILTYKEQKNKVNNMKKKAKENFESNYTFPSYV